MSNPLLKSAAVATAKTACCALVGMAGAHVGMLALGSLGVAAALKPGEKLLEFAFEKASEIAGEIGLAKWEERERNDPLERAFQQALRKALNEIRTTAEKEQRLGGPGAMLADYREDGDRKEEKDWAWWFKNWDKALETPVVESFDQIPLGEDTGEEAELRLREFLKLLNAQGAMLEAQKATAASLRLVTFRMDELSEPPAELVAWLKERLPDELPPIFEELLTSERNEQANKMYVNRFIKVFTEKYGPVILEIRDFAKETNERTKGIAEDASHAAHGVDDANAKLDLVVGAMTALQRSDSFHVARGSFSLELPTDREGMGLPPRPEQKDPTNTFLVSQIESDRAKHQIEVQRIQDERDRAERRVRHIEECVERVRQAVEDARRGGA
jgi:hypothetical protein